MRRPRILVPAAAAVIALAAGVLWLGRRAAPAPVAAAAAGSAQGPSLRLRWPAGTRALYDLAWTSRAGALVAPADGQRQEARLAAASDVAGAVAIESLGEADGDTVLAVSYASLETFSFTLQGQDALGGDKGAVDALAGHRVLVALSPRGEVRSVAFAPGVPVPAQTALRSLVQQLLLTLPAGGEATWEAGEPHALGRLRFAYAREGQRIARKPVAFESLEAIAGKLDGEQELDGAGLASIDDASRLESIRETGKYLYRRPGQDEPAVSLAFTFVLTRRSEAPFDPAALRAALATARPQPLAQRIDDPDRARRRDQRLAGSLTLDDVFTVMEHFEKGQRPGHDFIVKAGAYLRLHPEAAARLAERFRDPALGFRGKGLLIDALASAGDANAQKVMRGILASDEARKDPRDLGMLVQRFSLIEDPEPASERFLEEELVRARGARQVPAEQGAAAALGAMSDRLRRAGQADLASSAAESIASELRQTENPNLQRALLAGLGNARRPEDVPQITAFLSNEDPRLRLEVASALRWMETPDAHDALLRLASDGDANVAGSAVEALEKHALAQADWDGLRSLVQSGRFPPGADAPLVDLIRRNREKAGEQGTEILRALLARNTSPDSDLRTVIRELLEGTGG